MNEKQVEKFNKIVELIRHDTVTPKEIEQFLLLVLNVIKDARGNLDAISKDTLTEIADALDTLKKNHSQAISEIDQKTTETTAKINNKFKEVELFLKEVKKMRLKGENGKDGKDGKDADPEIVAKIVLEKLPKIEETGETIADKLETLKGDKRLDASAIKNLPELVESKANGGGWRNLFQLHDVDSSDTTTGYVLTRKADGTFDFQAGSGGGTWGSITGTLSDQTDLQTALDSKVDENVAITGATKTKITYDAKGLVTAGADATTADIADSSNKRYVTDAQLTVIGNTSGTNTGDQDLSSYLTSATAASTYQPLDTQLTSLAGLSYTGNSLKVVRVNAGETDFELATISAGSGDVSKVGTPVNNQLGIWTGDGTIEGDSNVTYDSATGYLHAPIMSVNSIFDIGTHIAGVNISGNVAASGFNAYFNTNSATVPVALLLGTTNTYAKSVRFQAYPASYSTSGMEIADNGALFTVGMNFNVGTYSNHNMDFWTNNTRRGGISNAGAVDFTGALTVGGTGTFSDQITLNKNQNGATSIRINNLTTGTAAQADFRAYNDAGYFFALGIYSSGTSTYGALTANSALNYGSGTGGIVLMADNASGTIRFAAGGNTERWRINSTGLIAGADNTYDIGASGATRPRAVYVGTTVVSPLFNGGTTGIVNTGTIELGHASANTLSASGGILSIEGVAIPTVSNTVTLTNKTLTAPLLTLLVEANTAGVASPNIITSAESYTTYTNEGATALNYHTLPTAVAGLTFTWVVQDVDGIRIVANTGDTIRVAGVVSGAAGYTTSVAIGDSITLTAINATEWIAESEIG